MLPDKVSHRIYIFPLIFLLSLVLVFVLSYTWRSKIQKLENMEQNIDELLVATAEIIFSEDQFIIQQKTSMEDEINTRLTEASEYIDKLMGSDLIPKDQSTKFKEEFDEHREVLGDVVAFISDASIISEGLDIWVSNAQEVAINRIEAINIEETKLMMLGSYMHPARREFRNSLQELLALLAMATLEIRNIQIEKITKNVQAEVVDILDKYEQVFLSCRALSKITNYDEDKSDWEAIAHALTGMPATIQELMSLRLHVVINYKELVESTRNMQHSLHELHKSVESLMVSSEKKLWNMLFAFLGSFMLATIFLSILVARKTMAPLNTLEKASGALSQGDFTYEVGILDGVEFDRVGRAFNQMAVQLGDTLSMLQQSEERLRIFFEIAPAGIILWDREGSVVEWNKKAEEIFGYSTEEATGKTFWELIIPESEHEAVKKVSYALFLGEEQLNVRNNNITKNGDMITCEWNNIPFHMPDGTVVGAISIATDITKQLADAAEREQMAQQLRQTQKLEAIGTLAGGIAHDFNNILGSIIGYTQIVLGRVPKGSEDEEDLNEVLIAGRRAKELVTQILTFSRKAAEKREVIHMHLLVGEAMRLLRQTIPSTIEIEMDISKERDTVYGDTTQIHQIIMNLCTNAYQSIENKKGKLSVYLHSVELDPFTAKSISGLPAGSFVKLSVQDTGIGIPQELLEKVFEPFYTTKPPGEGTGMGLSVVHGIVKGHGGSIVVESKPNKGTRVDVYLPFQENILIVENEEEKKLPRGNEKILVVDDEPALANIVEKILSRLGYSTKKTTSSREALEWVASDPDAFDLILTDQTMPEMEGSNLAIELMKIRSDLPIVICTGYSVVSVLLYVGRHLFH